MTGLRALRRAQGKTVAQVAHELGMSERHLRRLETGKALIKPVLVHAFADYYGVTPDEIRPATEAAA